MKIEKLLKVGAKIKLDSNWLQGLLHLQSVVNSNTFYTIIRSESSVFWEDCSIFWIKEVNGYLTYHAVSQVKGYWSND